MRTTWGIAFRWACTAGLLAGIAFATPAAAQSRGDDAAAREYFNAGRVAFSQGDFESALIYMRHAYRTSGRAALLYNIGLAADRLGRDQEALEAYQQYLDETESPPRELEVRRRIEALRKSSAEEEAAARALTEAEVRDTRVKPDRKSRRRDAPPVPTALNIGTTEPRTEGVAFQTPKYSEPVDQPTTKKKKWPWIVAAAAVVVAGGVTAGVVLSQRSSQSSQPEGGFTVSW